MLTAAVHWLLAAHAPTPSPDVATSAAVPVFIHSPLTSAVDAVNAVPVGQDLALASWLVLVTVAGVTTAWTTRLGVSPWLATALGIGVTLLPHTWSTHAPGRDAGVLLLLMMIALASWASTAAGRRAARHGGTVAAVLALLLIAHQPATVWLLVPVALVSTHGSWRSRGLWTLASIAVAVAATLLYADVAMHGAPCLSGSGGRDTRLWELLRPGAMAGTDPTSRLAHLRSAVASEFHVFGLAAAAWAAWLQGSAHPVLRRTTVAVLSSLVIAAAAGTASLHLLVATATVAWVPWFALACQRLASLAPSRQSMMTQLAVAWLAVGLPLARHAVFVPDPLAAGGPGLWAAGYTLMGDAVMAAATSADARLAHRAGRALVAPDARAIAECLSRTQTVMAIGTAIDMLRHDGITVDDAPLTVPLAALSHDLRPGAVVALGLTSEATRWLRSADVTRVAVLGANAEATRRRHAQAVVSALPAPQTAAPTPAAPPVTAHSARLAAVGARRLWHPISADVEPDAVRVLAGAPVPQPIVLGTTAAVVVFDRTERPVIRASATARPGLPMPLYSTLPTLRLGRVREVTSNRAVPRGVLLLPAELPPPVDADTAATRVVHVGAGWHDAEPAGRLAFRWSAGREATAVFTLDGPAPLVITLTASPAQTATHANALHLRMNGVPVAHDIDGSRSIEIPAAVTRAGHNTLTFATDSVVPAGTIPGEPRTLAAVVRDLRVVQR